jgi:hypothetical protein
MKAGLERPRVSPAGGAALNCGTHIGVGRRRLVQRCVEVAIPAATI